MFFIAVNLQNKYLYLTKAEILSPISEIMTFSPWIQNIYFMGCQRRQIDHVYHKFILEHDVKHIIIQHKTKQL